jgi:hypothetical protein
MPAKVWIEGCWECSSVSYPCGPKGSIIAFCCEARKRLYDLGSMETVEEIQIGHGTIPDWCPRRRKK